MSKAAKICALCVNTGEAGAKQWLRVKKSTALTISMNPESETFDYIADEAPSNEIKQYAPAIDQDLAVLPGEPDYEWFFETYKKQETGTDAHHEFLTIYLCDKEGSAYYAETQDAILSFTDFNAVDGVLNYNISFCGTRTVGTATVNGDTYTFTASGDA